MCVKPDTTSVCDSGKQAPGQVHIRTAGVCGSGKRASGQNSHLNFGLASRKMSAQDIATFAGLCELSVSVEMATALAGNGITTVVKLLGKRGMNLDDPSDAGLANVLTICNNVDPSIDVNLNNGDCDGLRALQILCRKTPNVASVVAPDAATPAAGSAQEAAANATKAVELYKRLLTTQGVSTSQKMHLDYALISQMSNLQQKNGTINRRIGLTNIVAQSKMKHSVKELGFGLKFSMEDADDDDCAYKYNEVTLMLRCFYTALAAILSYEVDPNPDRDGQVPVLASDGSGDQMCVAGTMSACFDLMFEVVKAIGLYPLKYADSIFRNSFGRAMELAADHHFDRAVKLLVEYHPSAFRPEEEELRIAEAGRGSTTPGRAPGQKSKGGGTTPQPQPKVAKKTVDKDRPPCHGIAYNGVCKKEACGFDHHAGRCKAFKEANPDGPPQK